MLQPLGQIPSQTQLIEQSELFRVLVEQAPVAIALFDRNLCYQCVSQRWRQDYGLSEDVIGKSCYEVLPDLATHWREIHQRCLEQPGAACGTDQIQLLNGTIGQVRWEMTPWRDREGNTGGLIMYSELIMLSHQSRKSSSNQSSGWQTPDSNLERIQQRSLIEQLQKEINERKRTEVELTALLAAMTDVIFVLDAQGTYLKIASTNPAGRYKPSNSLIGKTMHESLPPEQADQLLRCIQEALRIKQAVSVEYCLWIEGEWLWFDGTVSPLPDNTVIWVARDISERVRVEDDRKRAEAALHYSEQRFRDVSEAAGEYIWEIDANAIYTFVTDKAKTVKGYEPSELLGHTPFEFMPPEDVEQVAAILQEVSTKKSAFKLEHRDITPTGDLVWEEVNGVPILDGKGEIIGFRGAGLSITDRKRAVASLQRMQISVDYAADPIFWIQPDTQFFYVNQAACRTLGYSQEELVSMSVFDVDMDLPREGWAAHWQGLKQRGSFTLESHHCTRSGRIFPVEVTVNYLKFNGEEYNCLVVRDISERQAALQERKQAEAELREFADRQSLLNRLANQIRNSLELDVVLDTALQAIHALLEIDYCFFAWHDPNVEFPVWEVIKEAKCEALPSVLGRYPTHLVGLSVEYLLTQEVLQTDNIADCTDSIYHGFLQTIGSKSSILLTVETSFDRVGLIVCDHKQQVRPWTKSEVELLKAVTAQVAIAIDQAELYKHSLAAARTAQNQAQQLEETLQSLKKAQIQLVHSEKMSSLGQMVAGVAHEINNPVSFIYGNVTHLRGYAVDLLNLLALYQTEYPQPGLAIQAKVEEIDLAFLHKDLPKLLTSMQVGTNRIRDIVRSLRVFSRLDEAECKAVDLHEGIDSTLMILQNRLRPSPDRTPISIVKEYGHLPLVQCYAGQLNQVFMNILANAIDALEDVRQSKIQNPTIQIRTERVDDRVLVRIHNNGSSIPEGTQQHLFDAFFTTKPVGQGTGLGLSISYQIVTEKHGGQLECVSLPEFGTEFTIAIPITQLQKN